MVLQTYKGHPSTTVYHRKPLVGSDNPNILLFIPGNPGLIEFYITYLELIQKQFPEFEVFAVGHAGYQTTDVSLSNNQSPTEFKYYDLQYQINHKYEIFKTFILQRYDETETEVNLYFLSHSMGSYICQRVTKRLLDCGILYGKFNIRFSGLICPTIMDIAKSDNGVKFDKLFTYLPFITMLLWFAWLLDVFLTDSTKKRIIKTKFINVPPTTDLDDPRVVESIDNSVAGIFNMVKSSRIIRQALTMAQQELQEILTESSMNDWYFSNSKNVWAFFAPYDYWVHNSTRDYLLEKYHNLQENIRFEIGNDPDPITHSFCVHQSVRFAEITIQRMNEFFPSGIP